MRGQCLYRYELTFLSLASSEASVPQGQQLVLVEQTPASAPPSFQTGVPISRGHPGGPRWQHIENCYELYRTALTRFHPQPFTLKTPDGFRFYDGGGQQMHWYKHTLLIPKDFLDMKWRHALLPELARQLMYYNAPDLRVFELLNSYPRSALATFFFLATFNFLWVPTLVKNSAGERWQGERVLDSDLYACTIGEAMWLRTRLHAELEALQLEGLIDSSFPTLDERIEQINAFINEEATQLRALSYTRSPSQKTPYHLHVRLIPPAASNAVPQLESESTRKE